MNHLGADRASGFFNSLLVRRRAPPPRLGRHGAEHVLAKFRHLYGALPHLGARRASYPVSASASSVSVSSGTTSLKRPPASTGSQAITESAVKSELPGM